MAEKQDAHDHDHDHDDDHYEEQKEETLATAGVIDKYKDAGKIANDVLKAVIEKCKPNANIIEICQFGDALINDLLSKVYVKKKLEKGIAFPTCISVNEICGHFSPLASDPRMLSEGDVAKIDLGVHIDGYIALVAHTIVVQNDSNKPVEGRKADVILAAYKAVQGALRKLMPGNKNGDASEVIAKVSEAYQVNPIEGVLSHELKKHLIDGNACIINKETYEQKVEEHEFMINEVFGLDVIVSTGEGKPRESEYRTTVYKRAIEKTYNLKQKSARIFYNEINNKFPSLCFSLRSFEDEITAKIGVKECLEHELLVPYPVLLEKQGDIVAQFKMTVLILQGQTQAITGLPLDETKFVTEKKIEDQAIIDLLNVKMDKESQQKAKKAVKNKKKAEGQQAAAEKKEEQKKE